MSTAELKELRQGVKKYIDHAEERVVKKIYEILEAEAENEKIQSIYLTPEQEAILDERIEKYERGQMKFSSWEEAKAQIISNRKNAI